MAKFTIAKQVGLERLEKVVPPEYGSRVAALGVRGASHTVILFAHDRRDIVTSAPVRTALRRISGDALIVAVGATFTVEARELLVERAARIASLGDFYWTDAAYTTIRNH